MQKTEITEYGENSISSLKGADRVREKPEVIFGSRDLEGCIHAFFEILSNSVDEARAGFGTCINITAYSDRSIEVEDFGRGIPLGFNEKEGRYNWDLIFCEMYAGGKYKHAKDSASYEYALGTNGLGACATQYASEFMKVCSYNGKTKSEIDFERGSPITDLRVTELKRSEARTGTVIHWKPDNTIFTSIKIKRERFSDILMRQAVVNSGIKFTLKWQEEDGSFSTEEYLYNEGITDYVKEIADGKNLTSPVFWEETVSGVINNGNDGDGDEEGDEAPAGESSNYKLKMSVAFCVSAVKNHIEYYHNSSYLEHGGSPDKAVQTAFVYALDKYCRDAGKYTKNEARITVKDVFDCLILVTNCFSNIISYENQTKKAISNKFIRDEMTSFFKKNLEIYFTENQAEAEKFVSQVLVNKRSREQAESTRINIKKKLTGNIDISNRVEKFVGCRSKDPDKRELYIVEGDSAMSSCKLARNAEFQAIIPVRGKTLNCLKSSYDKIFSSDIITDLIRVIGCGVEVDKKIKGDIPRFNPDMLKWNKVIICTDADEDGFQIRTLILTMIYRLLPSLITMGKVYIAESPLFEITTKDEIYFAYDEREKIKILKEIGDKKYTLQRSKGLGENEADMMSKTTMNPASRRLVKITEADAEETAEIFDTLLGDNIAARKEYIANNGSKYLAEADI